MEIHTKPPLGFPPKIAWLEARVREIDEAIARRLGTEHPIYPEWLEERTELLEMIQKHDRKE